MKSFHWQGAHIRQLVYSVLDLISLKSFELIILFIIIINLYNTLRNSN